MATRHLLWADQLGKRHPVGGSISEQCQTTQPGEQISPHSQPLSHMSPRLNPLWCYLSWCHSVVTSFLSSCTVILSTYPKAVPPLGCRLEEACGNPGFSLQLSSSKSATSQCTQVSQSISGEHTAMCKLNRALFSMCPLESSSYPPSGNTSTFLSPPAESTPEPPPIVSTATVSTPFPRTCVGSGVLYKLPFWRTLSGEKPVRTIN